MATSRQRWQLMPLYQPIPPSLLSSLDTPNPGVLRPLTEATTTGSSLLKGLRSYYKEEPLQKEHPPTSGAPMGRTQLWQHPPT